MLDIEAGKAHVRGRRRIPYPPTEESPMKVSMTIGGNAPIEAEAPLYGFRALIHDA
jgi:hypothetical protein